MAFVLPPVPDHVQQRWYMNSRGISSFQPVGPRRRYPREQPFTQYDPILKGWYQGHQRKSTSFRPNHYWTRPNDGKRSGTWGRIKDALTNEGADVFITTSGDKRTLMRDRPQKWQWSGWPVDRDHAFDFVDPDDRAQDHMYAREMPWTGTSSRLGALYNFRTRKYETAATLWQKQGLGPRNRVWRDAQWKPNAKRSDTNPLSWQTPDENWWSRIPLSAGRYPGGRPRF